MKCLFLKNQTSCIKLFNSFFSKRIQNINIINSVSFKNFARNVNRTNNTLISEKEEKKSKIHYGNEPANTKNEKFDSNENYYSKVNLNKTNNARKEESSYSSNARERSTKDYSNAGKKNNKNYNKNDLESSEQESLDKYEVFLEILSRKYNLTQEEFESLPQKEQTYINKQVLEEELNEDKEEEDTKKTTEIKEILPTNPTEELTMDMYNFYRDVSTFSYDKKLIVIKNNSDQLNEDIKQVLDNSHHLNSIEIKEKLLLTIWYLKKHYIETDKLLSICKDLIYSTANNTESLLYVLNICYIIHNKSTSLYLTHEKDILPLLAKIQKNLIKSDLSKEKFSNILSLISILSYFDNIIEVKEELIDKVFEISVNNTLEKLSFADSALLFSSLVNLVRIKTEYLEILKEEIITKLSNIETDLQKRYKNITSKEKSATEIDYLASIFLIIKSLSNKRLKIENIINPSLTIFKLLVTAKTEDKYYYYKLPHQLSISYFIKFFDDLIELKVVQEKPEFYRNMMNCIIYNCNNFDFEVSGSKSVTKMFFSLLKSSHSIASPVYSNFNKKAKTNIDKMSQIFNDNIPKITTLLIKSINNNFSYIIPKHIYQISFILNVNIFNKEGLISFKPLLMLLIEYIIMNKEEFLKKNITVESYLITAYNFKKIKFTGEEFYHVKEVIDDVTKLLNKYSLSEKEISEFINLVNKQIENDTKTKVEENKKRNIKKEKPITDNIKDEDNNNSLI